MTQPTTQLKYLYTKAHSMSNKHKDLEAIVLLESYDQVAITETWWDESNDWSAAIDGYRLFKGMGKEGELVTGSIAQLKCIYSNVHSIGNKQDELEAIVQQENYDIVAITETWWDDSHNWSAAMDGYKLFRGNGQGKRGGGVAFYVREFFDCLELDDGDERVECLWVRIREKAKADTMVGAGYRPPTQDEEADNIFYKQLEEVS
ncbi:mitochondrial fission process protein 1 [Limosa lapponica baueri]|uniref:Mitochondrial fission process protein 1 n=1 Tax=Limosa lapponica baueri TaxID=1758121 RepID=A0A2I0TCH6_LIMLA|nr:mitochondrial fission process protein 1 [Limosa lapponica baueri]